MHYLRVLSQSGCVHSVLDIQISDKITALPAMHKAGGNISADKARARHPMSGMVSRGLTDYTIPRFWTFEAYEVLRAMMVQDLSRLPLVI